MHEHPVTFIYRIFFANLFRRENSIQFSPVKLRPTEINVDGNQRVNPPIDLRRLALLAAAVRAERR